VLLQQIPAREPFGTLIRDRTRVILATGEMTGHIHEVVSVDRGSTEHPGATVIEDPDGSRYLIVERACVLAHDEHDPIAIAPGWYQVILQREYEPAGVRHVLD
jgi:hypothetical protein